MKFRYFRNLDDFCFINRNFFFVFFYVMVLIINIYNFDYIKECFIFFNNCKQKIKKDLKYEVCIFGEGWM